MLWEFARNTGELCLPRSTARGNLDPSPAKDSENSQTLVDAFTMEYWTPVRSNPLDSGTDRSWNDWKAIIRFLAQFHLYKFHTHTPHCILHLYPETQASGGDGLAQHDCPRAYTCSASFAGYLLASCMYLAPTAGETEKEDDLEVWRGMIHRVTVSPGKRVKGPASKEMMQHWWVRTQWRKRRPM